MRFKMVGKVIQNTSINYRRQLGYRENENNEKESNKDEIEDVLKPIQIIEQLIVPVRKSLLRRNFIRMY